MQKPLAVISLRNIRSNARALARAARRPLIAVVKDDAYGHGAERVALEIADMVCMFAVATVDEGARLKSAGVGRDVLVLTPLTRDMDALRAGHYGLIVTAASFPSLAFCTGLRTHIAVNTGMNRYGFSPREVGEAVRLAGERGVRVEGVFSHLYEPSDKAARSAQERAFVSCAQTVQGVFPDAMRHLCATGGILAGGARCDAVRPGLGLYGYAPPPFANTFGLRPAMRRTRSPSARVRATLPPPRRSGRCIRCARGTATDSSARADWARWESYAWTPACGRGGSLSARACVF